MHSIIVSELDTRIKQLIVEEFQIIIQIEKTYSIIVAKCEKHIQQLQ